MIMEIWQAHGMYLLTTLLQIVGLVIVLLLGTAYLTYAERKVLAAMQLRRGPNTTGPLGLLQPMADAVKLLGKETIIPAGADAILFLGAPIFTFFLALTAWAVIPLDDGIVLSDINVGVLYLFALSSMGVYGIIIAGWASNSKYAFLGGLRSAAQMISYEVAIGLVLVSVLIHADSLNLSRIVAAQQDGWFLFSSLFPMGILFFVAGIAETNRHPFDLPEGESELVGGFNTEYSSMSFALFFLSEYANMILMAALTSILFLGGWLPPCAALAVVPGFVWFALKISLCLFIYLWARAALPRYRYDQLMRIGWKFFLPLALLWVVLTAALHVFGPRGLAG